MSGLDFKTKKKKKITQTSYLHMMAEVPFFCSFLLSTSINLGNNARDNKWGTHESVVKTVDCSVPSGVEELHNGMDL